MYQLEESRREFLRKVGLGAAGMAMGGCLNRRKIGVRYDRPNVVIIFTDDQGYQDVGCFGAKGFKTPKLDRMAKEGVRFTDFYVAAGSCTPSRAALMTGCYPQRIGLPKVLGPHSKIGISAEEETLAEVLKTRGYATGCFGKWHLGDSVKFLPKQHGFDEYFGLPYSNDMWPEHPTVKSFPPLPLIEGNEVVAYNPDQTKLTTWYTQRAVRFIENNKGKPFFLYVPHNMPHVPLFVSDKFKGRSKRGLYGDVIMEIDWSVGRILAALRRNHLDKNTLVIFTSDNGPWLSYGDHAGSAGPLREGKGTTWDGGQREACIMWWPGRIPGGRVCGEMVSSIDILPTVARLAGAKRPVKEIDGKNIWPLIEGEAGAKSPHEAFYFYQGDQLQAVRSGRWKLHFPHIYRTLGGKPGGTGGMPAEYIKGEIGLALFDLKNDIGEKNDVAEQHPDIVQKLSKIGKEFDDKLKRTKREPGKREEQIK